MELLSPAGSFSALEYAVRNGADAVYFGGNLFNARLGAQNFDRDEMTAALDFCRLFGVKSYITMNTLTHDRDLYSALQYASFLYEHGADALIIQDVGLFSLMKKHIPDFELHASTQMCISTLEGVRKCEEMGFSRVVLSRELSLSDVSYITQNSKMPIEVFVHGAMCMSFSGGCLFSSMVGGRSGNCGSCAQPCRKYAAVDKMPQDTDLALSLADLCMLEHTDDLARAGVVSLKIEGRMKKPEYIAAVTHAYRRALDGADKNELAELRRELFEVFNRGEFTTGYYFGDGGRTDRIGCSAPSESTRERVLGRSVRGDISADFELYAHTGDKSRLRAVTDKTEVTVYGDTVDEAKKPITEQTRDRAAEQIGKLGGTPFCAHSITTDITGFVPVSSLNELRREAVKALTDAYSLRRETPDLPASVTLPPVTPSDVTYVIAHVNTTEQAKAAYESGTDEILLEYGEFDNDDIQALQYMRERARLGLSLPVTLLRESYELMRKSINPCDFDTIEINNIGQLEYARAFSHVTGGYHLNAFNSHSAKALLDMGLERITLSVELSASQIREAESVIPSEKLTVFAYGRVTLMNLYHCPVKEHIGCKKCGKRMHTLYDADGRAFPIKGFSKVTPCALTRLYNCYAQDSVPKLGKIGKTAFSLVFTDEDAKKVRGRIAAVKSGGGDALPDTTRGCLR